jgi:hypothetical protein
MTELSFTVSRAATCRKCHFIYNASDAQTRKHDFICKPCKAEADRVSRERRRAEGKRVSGRNLGPAYHKVYQAEYSLKPEVRAKRAERARQRVRNPAERHKHEARWQTRRAIASGALVRQPCEVCGNPKVDAHHDDYSRPLDVRWLCRAHHNEHHAKARGSHE